MQPLINMIFQLQPAPSGQAIWTAPAPTTPAIPLAMLPPPPQTTPQAQTVIASRPVLIEEVPQRRSTGLPVRIDSRSPARTARSAVRQSRKQSRQARSRSRSPARSDSPPPLTTFRQGIVLRSVTPSRPSRLEDTLANAPWRTRLNKGAQRPISPAVSPKRSQGVWKSPSPAPERHHVALSWPSNLSLPDRKRLPSHLHRSAEVRFPFPPIPPLVPPPSSFTAIDGVAQPSTPPDALLAIPARKDALEGMRSAEEKFPIVNEGNSSSAYGALPDNIHTAQGRKAFVDEESQRFQLLDTSSPEVQAIRRHLKHVTDDDVMSQIQEDNLNLLCKVLACTSLQGNVHYPLGIKMDKFDNYQIFQLPMLAMRGPSCPESSVGLQRYVWCHGTTTQGIIGILKARQVLKSLPSPDAPTYGFFAAGTNDATSNYEQLRITVARWESSKNDAGLLVLGTAASTRTQAKVHAGGTYEEQRKCKTNDVAHNPKERRWCFKPKISQITALCFCQLIETVTSPE